ncbi:MULTISPECIES: DUF3107 domain-containing protein [unclassified Frankia]|uniref:DUF3107 domain-containing protein n=1 Tax=unclassified Frankia TaxID=2632575 RepID=UPI001EF41C42|nr:MULTISPECIES: DUF3107 domain-containing protein [unclassified Frankia]
MEVKIGIQNVGRELVIESSQSSADVAQAVADAIGSELGLLTLVDEKSRQVIVPVAKLAYIEITEAETRRVGFGSL